ncbi:unnamed protein product [Cyprideis torosa]|uniref:Cytidyltransferase-like domain-containing protein n=1 Tax=Cyprideis torosa TaxID=163714 RepID=A0A7R8X1G2_9CRUS|nr:unnamed protein product [Cyprideis torosa]CAG0911057.1 unnamed protein product [Cyprideis torosa]
MVSPGNPLKPTPPASLSRRIEAARAMIQHPNIIVSDYEAQIGTRFTAQTLSHLRADFPDVSFAWLMGADNLAQFHLWDSWHDIMNAVPVGVLARPGARMRALYSPAARIYRFAKLPSEQSRLLCDGPTPRWCFVNLPMRGESSTAIRAAGEWTTGNGAK